MNEDSTAVMPWAPPRAEASLRKRKSQKRAEKEREERGVWVFGLGRRKGSEASRVGSTQLSSFGATRTSPFRAGPVTQTDNAKTRPVKISNAN